MRGLGMDDPVYLALTVTSQEPCQLERVGFSNDFGRKMGPLHSQCANPCLRSDSSVRSAVRQSPRGARVVRGGLEGGGLVVLRVVRLGARPYLGRNAPILIRWSPR